MRFFGLFMLLISGPILGVLIVPLALTNAQLDSLPVTPLLGVEPGKAYKVYATIAPNQADVVHGYWSGNTWTWTIQPFLLFQNGTELLVNSSNLANLREPGSPWGSQSGTVLYGSGDWVAVYGSAVRIGNSTVLEAQYIAGDPTAMGKSGGDLWPLVAGGLGLFAIMTLVGVWLVARQRSRHFKGITVRTPHLVPPSPRPPGPYGEVRRFEDGGAIRRDRRSTRLLVAGAPSFLLGILLMATDLLVPVFIGLLLLILGGFFLLLGIGGRLGRWSEVNALTTDDSGIWIEPLVQEKYPDDQYFAWKDLASFWLYSFGSLGCLIALRSRRGEITIGSFADVTCKQIGEALKRHGLPEKKDWRYEPLCGTPLA